MIAYNALWLKYLSIRQQAEKGRDDKLLPQDEWEQINLNYPMKFYSPNIFIRIGLFVLTTVILLFSFGIIVLLFLDSIDSTIGGIAIFFSFISYALLEYIVQTKRHLQSGVDDALIWISAACLFGGSSYLSGAAELANCVLVFFISLYFSLRFGDRVMSLVVYLAFLSIVFFWCVESGPLAKKIVPFVLMLASATIYIFARKARKIASNHLYENCLQVVLIAALLGVYFTGNYYIVRELNNELFNSGQANAGPPLGWVFWLFTFVVPFLYLARGIQKKDRSLIRIGLLLIAVTICTAQYYHPLTSNEILMIAVALVLLALSYALTNYLKRSRFGFTNDAGLERGREGDLQIEALGQAQALSNQPAAPGGTSFGGGSFGGGGASSDF